MCSMCACVVLFLVDCSESKLYSYVYALYDLLKVGLEGFKVQMQGG